MIFKCYFSGAETGGGFQTLTHGDLCKYYPLLFAGLEEMASGTGLKRLLSATTLPYLDGYKELASIAHKGHKAIFGSLFKDLQLEDKEGSGELKISVVLKTSQLICAAYLKVWRTKTDKHYGDEGLVRKMLENDPKCFDGVPINALGAEGQVSFPGAKL